MERPLESAAVTLQPLTLSIAGGGAAGGLRFAAQWPEPGHLWIRYAPRGWEGPERPWLDLAAGRLGRNGRAGSTGPRASGPERRGRRIVTDTLFDAAAADVQGSRNQGDPVGWVGSPLGETDTSPRSPLGETDATLRSPLGETGATLRREAFPGGLSPEGSTLRPLLLDDLLYLPPVAPRRFFIDPAARSG